MKTALTPFFLILLVVHYMMLRSKVMPGIVPHFVLPQSHPIFVFSWCYAPLHTHIGAGHKVIHPPASKLAGG